MTDSGCVDVTVDLYPFAAIRGYRQTRLEEQSLGPFQLDGPTASRLSCDNAGIFVGNCPSLGRIVTMLWRLAEAPFPGRWMAVLASRRMAALVYNRLASERGWRIRKHAPKHWDQGSVTFTTPEGLRTWHRERLSTPVAGILLIDPLCHVHRARNRIYTAYGVHDRPQRVADFRADVAQAGMLPPFLLFTERPAKSIHTAAMLSPYCLDTWWFVDGARLRVVKPPSSVDV